jgi:methionyl-tRNA synthetase
MSLADKANQYIDKNEPWVLNKDVASKERVHTISSTAINLFRILNLYLEPVIPETSLKIKNYLKCNESIINIKNILVNHKIESFKPLIIRVEDEEILRVIEASTNG